MDTEDALTEVLFEFVVHGNYVKVMAVDPKSGREVSIVGDGRTSRKHLESLATKKLRMVLKKSGAK